jgi:hypothetical protein
MKGPNSEEMLMQNPDRRRSPRFSCSGLAKIICLPSEGVYLAGKLRDLSLNGCGIETVSTIECGARTEILLQISSASFRAIGEVKAARVPGGIGMEFLRLSGHGRDILAGLLRELARQQAIATTLRAAQREPEQWKEARATLLRASLPVFGRIAASEADEAKPLADRSSLILDEELRVMPVDLFL